jgi:hypothetical protein
MAVVFAVHRLSGRRGHLAFRIADSQSVIVGGCRFPIDFPCSAR